MRSFIGFFITALCVLAAAGCGSGRDNDHGGHNHAEHGHGDHGHDHGGGHAVSVTRWGGQAELFMEYEPLVAGKPSSFLIHLTRLEDFSAVTDAEVMLLFTGAEGKVWKFLASQPLREGIFKPAAQIEKPGLYRFEIKIEGPQVTDAFDLGEVTVYENAKKIPHGEEPEAGGEISFLKEQQWQGNFDVQEVRVREIAPVVKAQGQVRAPVNATRVITAEASGFVVPPAPGLPLLGTSVEAGQKLGEIRPEGGSSVDVVSPVSGVIAVVHVRADDRVEAGGSLFEIIDLGRVWVEAQVFEPDVPKIRGVQEALIQVPGQNGKIPSSAVVSVGAAIDQVSRTLPVVFEVPNPEGLFKVGASVPVEIRTGRPEQKPAIPRSALVDVDGKWVVYVQTGGESFEQRGVVTGAREGDWVEIQSGVETGERVVTEGAYTVRLASAATEVPAHGHSH